MQNNKNPLSFYKDNTQKLEAYMSSCQSGAVAYKSDNTRVPLKEMNINDVEFIGGLWRVQTKPVYNIQRIRDRDMIIGDKIQRTEKTFFNYYKASFLVYNCYGPIEPKFDMVAAEYKTDKCTYWAYGKTIAEARAFMGIKLYDEYKDLINSVACKGICQKEKK